MKFLFALFTFWDNWTELQKRRARSKSKSVKRGPTLSPFQERLKETDFHTQPKIDEFAALPSTKVSKDRCMKVILID